MYEYANLDPGLTDNGSFSGLYYNRKSCSETKKNKLIRKDSNVVCIGFRWDKAFERKNLKDYNSNRCNSDSTMTAR